MGAFIYLIYALKLERRKYNQSRNYELFLKQIEKIREACKRVNANSIYENVMKVIEDFKLDTAYGDLGQDIADIPYEFSTQKEIDKAMKGAYSVAQRLLNKMLMYSEILKDFSYSLSLIDDAITKIKNKEYELRVEDLEFLSYELYYIYDPFYNQLENLNSFGESENVENFKHRDQKVEFFEKIDNVYHFLASFKKED